MNLSNSEIEMRCKSLRNAKWSHTRIANKLGISRTKVKRILGEPRLTRAQAGRLGADATKRMGFDRIGGMKTPCGARV